MIILKYNLQWIIKQKGYFDFEEELEFPPELFAKYAQINGLKNVVVFGNANLDNNNRRLYVDLNIKGIMLIPCALTLEEIEYPFNINSTEVFSFDKPDSEEDIREAKHDTVDLIPVVFENIMLEVPMRLVKDGATIESSGKGWKILDNESTKDDENFIDPRLAGLKDYFKKDK